MTSTASPMDSLPGRGAVAARSRWPSSSVLGEIFSRAVAFSLPLTYFLVVVSFYLRTYDSAQIKITLTQLGCSLVALLWALQLLFQKRWPFAKKDLPLIAPFLAVLASGIVSYVQSSFRTGSMDEFSRRIFYSLMALIVIAEFRGMDRQRRLMRWLIAGFAITVFYGFVQYFDGRLFPPGLTKVGLDPFIWRQAFGLRVFSSFGNPNFYGNFLVIITPILIALYFRSGGTTFRPFLLIALLVPVVILTDKLFANYFGGITAQNQAWVTSILILSLIAVLGVVWWKSPSATASGMLIFLGATFVNLYSTETKGAWVGFVAAIVAMAVLTGLFLVGRNARRVTYGLAAVALVISVLGLGVVHRYANKRKQSVDFRVFTWIATWDMIRTQPWLGTGIGTFKWAYPAFRRPEIILLEGRSNTETDHAEDEYLEIMYDEGVIGFGLFLWLVVSVSVLGIRLLNQLTQEGPRPPPDVVADRSVEPAPLAPARAFEDKVFMLLGYLGAWWAALIHWFMDVSVRFVSSGIFSFFLPALVTGFVRNAPLPERQDRPLSMDVWIRGVSIALWMVFFLIPDDHFQPLIGFSGVLFVGACLTVLGELLELRLSRSSVSRASILWAALLCAGAEAFAISNLFSLGFDAGHLIRIASASALFGVWMVMPRPPTSKTTENLSGGDRPTLFRLAAGGLAVALFLMGASVWRGYFLADVSHNVGIFFSKQAIWNRSPEFDQKVGAAGFPDDMKKEYERVGGAMEHYEKTFRLNPAFPMATYFIGNVFNDWGSAAYDASLQALQRGEKDTAEKLRLQAVDRWASSLDAYRRVKLFAPNYVQTHHQVGLVHLKSGDMETARGDKEKAEEQWKLALQNFSLYQKLDPVFPPNYYRQSYVYFKQGRADKSEEAYLGALVYNSTNVVNRTYTDRNVETYSNLGRLYYVQLVNNYPNGTPLPKDAPLLAKAEGYYLKALQTAQGTPQEDVFSIEPAKSLAVLYNRAGEADKAKELWLKLRAWAPDDADVKRVFSPPTDPGRK